MPRTTDRFARTHRPRLPGRAPLRLHVVAFAGGLLILVLGLVAWMVRGGPDTVEDVVFVLDLTIGGTILSTGALVGRARSQEGRRTVQLGVIQQAARRMTASLTSEDVGRVLVEETGRVIACHSARVYLLQAPDELVPVALDGQAGAYREVDPETLRTRIGEGLTGWAAQHRQPALVDDAAADPRGVTIAGTPRVDESMLVAPMLHDETLVGVITLCRLGLSQFDEDDLRLLSIMADQAATAFASASHLADAERLSTELRRLLEMSSALSRSLDPRAVADLMAEHLARAVGAGQAQISDWDAPRDRIRTLGCYPASIRPDIEDYYPLADFPQTRRVLEECLIAVVDAEDPDADPAEVAHLRSEGSRGLVMLPLVANGDAIGVVELTFAGRPEVDASRITLARTMAHEAAMALENARLYETARDLADRDPLTGFFNHRYLHERLSEEVVRATRYRRPLGVLMLDLDDFKLVNDTFGHVYGDRVLVHVAELIRSTIRASDVAARYGGDEFAVILPDTDRDAAMVVAERILAAFAATPFEAEGRQPFHIGTSIGVAGHPLDGRTATDLIAAADISLYEAKNLGGGRALAGTTTGLAHTDAAQPVDQPVHRETVAERFGRIPEPVRSPGGRDR
ncbi:MAG: diguanylate cyclase [Chloroflexota bacterium]